MTKSHQTERLRLAVIGGGHLGRIHAKLAASNEQFDVVGVADPSDASRSLVQEQLALPTYSDYRELLEQIDAAVVAAPTQAHYDITSTLLRSGVHCLVEKPLAHSADQAQRLVQIARNRGRVLQVGHVERFNPMWTTAQNEIGVPKFMEAMRAGPYSGRSTDIGVVMDLMVHDLDLMLSVDRSPVVQVQASGIAVLGSQEDIAEARIEFESGCIATLRASRIAQAPVRRMQLYSSSSYVDVDFSGEEVSVVKPTQDIVARAIALDELTPTQRMAAKDSIYSELLKPSRVPVAKRNAILDEQNDFALSILSNAAPSVTGEDGARAVEVAQRIVEAISQHRWDGVSSKPWRIGALASEEARILPLPQTNTAASVADAEQLPRRRRAG